MIPFGTRRNFVAKWDMGHFLKTSLGLVMVCALLMGALSSIGHSQTLLAQFESDDTYDPFADFSEFEDSQEEEADINFFRHGRFFTLGFIGGYRDFTNTLGDLYEGSPTYGVFLSYFFDLRFALQVSYLTGSHALSFKAPNSGTTVRGDVAISNLGVSLKYYINTQNVTKGLGQFNPYVIGGFSQVYRTATVRGQEAFSKDTATAFEIGGGIELPLLRNKMYFGSQLTYSLVNFKDENSEIILAGNTQTGIYPAGDMYTLLFILGVNF